MPGRPPLLVALAIAHALDPRSGHVPRSKFEREREREREAGTTTPTMSDDPSPSPLLKIGLLLLALALGIAAAWLVMRSGHLWLAPIVMLALALLLGALMKKAGWTKQR